MEKEEREGEMGVVKMITKTNFSKGGNRGISAYRLAKYIESRLGENRIYKALYYGYRPLRKGDLMEFREFADRVSSDKPGVRHMIIAPERRIEERELHYLVLKTMDNWIRRTENYGIRYVWGLHYNTEHPHAHIGMVSSYPEDLEMGTTRIRQFNRVVEEVFGEKIKGEKKIEEDMEREIKEAEEFEVGR